MKNNVNKILVLFFVIIAIGFSQDNYSLSFDGENDHIQISENDVLENIYQNNFSISVFVKPETIIAGFLSILRKDGAYNIMIQNGYLYAEKFVGGTMYHSTGNTQFNSEQWYHILVSWDGSNLSLYVDGQLDNNETQTAGINVPITSLWIGMGSAYGQGFNGKIDHLSMWSRLFNNEEIQYLKDYEINSEDSDLVGYWNFNSGDGGILNDQSGNGNNGQINGATWSGDGAPVEQPFPGCMDAYAENYNSEATSDDGSCSGYPDNGEYSLSFDNDNVSIGEIGDYSSKVTIMAWVKKDGTSGYSNIVSGGCGNLLFTENDNKLLFGSQCSNPIAHDTYGSTDIADNIWHHVAATYDADAGQNNLKVYVCLLYTSPSPRDRTRSRMPSSA